MYTMVLMMAATSGGDVAAFGLLRGGCHGSSCNGTTVVASSCHGTVSAPASSCHSTVVASSGCTGTVASSGCTGGSGLFGLKAKLFGGRGCTGSTVSSCHGSAPLTVSGSCHGTVMAVPVMSGSCHGTVMAAPVMMSGPVMGGCMPTMGSVGGPMMTPPVNMPVIEPKKEDPKKETPKKEDPKKEEKKQE